jgi:hypothetical protein
VTALEAVTALLGLRPAGAPGSTSTTARFGVVAGRSGPRFLVPLDHPAAAPQACLAYLGLRDLRTRATRGAAGLALRAGVRRGVIAEVLEADAGPGSLLDELGRLLEHPEHGRALAVAVGLGQHDEVWKPTLQVFRPDGEPAAFVKVGLGAVADQLVATEAATLALWGQEPDPRLVVPELLAEARWEGLRLAVVAPLPTDARRLPAQQVTDAWPVRELDGPLRTVAPADAPWWQARRAANAEHRRVDELLDRIEQRHRAPASWGRWHGDWVPWNLARCHRGLVAWDWEYSEPGAPVGLDEVHGAYQVARVGQGRSISAALAAARASTADPWLADAHLAMLVTRSTELERLTGRPPTDQLELLAAADAALARSSGR